MNSILCGAGSMAVNANDIAAGRAEEAPNYSLTFAAQLEPFSDQLPQGIKFESTKGNVAAA